MDVWFWFWAILAAVLVVAEIFTAGFFLLPFGLGAGIAAVLAFLDVALAWQWATFLVVSAAAFWGLRGFADRMTHEPPEKTGAERLIGKSGIVTERLERDSAIGRVRVEREDWRADAPGFEPVPEGIRVVVERIVGTHLVVRPVDVEAVEAIGKEG